MDQITRSTPDNPSPEIRPDEGPSISDSRWQGSDDLLQTPSSKLRERVLRQEGGLATLWSVLREETARREQMDAQYKAELQATVAGRNRLVGERDRAISDLQTELSDLRAENAMLANVRSELQAALAERNRLITERDRAITELKLMQSTRVWRLVNLYWRIHTEARGRLRFLR